MNINVDRFTSRRKQRLHLIRETWSNIKIMGQLSFFCLVLLVLLLAFTTINSIAYNPYRFVSFKVRQKDLKSFGVTYDHSTQSKISVS